MLGSFHDYFISESKHVQSLPWTSANNFRYLYIRVGLEMLKFEAFSREMAMPASEFIK